nr:hypothetical protein [Tanacetum cinerariifolium]
MALVLDQNRPRQVVELVHVGEDHPLFQGIDQVQQLTYRDRHLGGAHFVEEVEQHVGCPALIPKSLATATTAHECETLKQLHVLLVLHQRARQRRNGLGRIALAQHRFADVVGHQQFQPVHQLRGRRLLFEARDLAHVEEHIERFADQVFFDVGVVHIDDPLQGGAVREGDVMEETAAQERIRQLFFVVRGNDDDRALFRLDRFVDLVNVELHLLGAEGFGQLLGEHGLARARLAFDQQWTLQGNGSVDRQLQVVGSDVGRSAFELHRKILEHGA